MDKPWKVVFAFVAVFIAGAVFGGVFTLRGSGQRIVNRPANRPAAAGGMPQIGVQMMQNFAERLNLTPEQREKIRPVVARVSEDLQRLRRENFQANTRILERMHVDIAAWLTPEQRVELEEMKRRMQERVRNQNQDKREGGPRQPPPPRGDRGGLRNPEGQRPLPPKSEP